MPTVGRLLAGILGGWFRDGGPLTLLDEDKDGLCVAKGLRVTASFGHPGPGSGVIAVDLCVPWAPRHQIHGLPDWIFLDGAAGRGRKTDLSRNAPPDSSARVNFFASAGNRILQHVLRAVRCDAKCVRQVEWSCE